MCVDLSLNLKTGKRAIVIPANKIAPRFIYAFSMDTEYVNLRGVCPYPSNALVAPKRNYLA